MGAVLKFYRSQNPTIFKCPIIRQNAAYFFLSVPKSYKFKIPDCSSSMSQIMVRQVVKSFNASEHVLSLFIKRNFMLQLNY